MFYFFVLIPQTACRCLFVLKTFAFVQKRMFDHVSPHTRLLVHCQLMALIFLWSSRSLSSLAVICFTNAFGVVAVNESVDNLCPAYPRRHA